MSIDRNICFWASIDWEEELSAYLSAIADPDASQAQCEALQVNAGRCLVLMQEYINPAEYRAILRQSGKRDALETYRQIYIWDTRERLEAHNEA